MIFNESADFIHSLILHLADATLYVKSIVSIADWGKKSQFVLTLLYGSYFKANGQVGYQLALST